ncbi:MAG: response regulator [Anaerolineae bacterium]
MGDYTVLSIDDDQSARVLFQIMLKRVGFEVIQAEDADEALEKLATITPDLIITDIQLPGTSGIELTRILRTRPEFDQTAIIVLSAFQSEETIQQALDAGADEFMKKPLQMKDLEQRLGGVIAKRRLG